MIYPCKPDIFEATYEAIETTKGNMMVEIKEGPELNRAVAEASGWTWWVVKGPATYAVSLFQEVPGEAVEVGPYDPAIPDEILPAYSSNLNVAFAAAEKVGLFSGACGLSRDTPTRWSACKQDCILGVGPTPALAICAAILELREPRRARG